MEEKEAEEIKNVKIFVRILPLETICESSLKIDDNRKNIYVRCLQDMRRDRIVKSKSPVYWQFPTDWIFHNSSQKEVYEVVTKDLLDNILDGANCVLISYGQTGTGKSFTTSGLRNSYEHRGIIARLLSDMFEEQRNRKYSNRIEYRLSYVEMYQSQVNDLLVSKKEQQKFNVRDTLKHITSVSVRSEEETLRKIFEGEARKIINQGSTYDASHQGTSILTFHVSNVSLITSWAVTAHSKIHIVDMAGVDSAGKTNSRKSTERICNANLDKTQMEQFIIDLQNPKKPKIHRHNSNLLKYLGAAFSLGSLLRFVAHIRASNEDLVLTLSILRFSSNVKKLKPKKIQYEVEPESTIEIENLRKDIAALKQQLDINDMLFHQEPLANISTSRAKQIERDAIDFINGSLDDLMLLNVSQAQILLKTFKEMFSKLEADHKIALQQATKNAYDSAATDLKGSTLSVTKTSKTTSATGSNGKMKRKKSVVDRLSKVTSQPSLDEDETTKIKVGEVVDTGITIGPSQLGPAIGPVVRLMKIRKYGEPPNRATVPCCNLVEPVMTSKEIEKDEAFECYLKEDENAITLKQELDVMETARKDGQAKLTELISNYQEIKTEMESARVEFHKQQSIRHLRGNEVYDNEGRVLISELERRLFNCVTSLEKKLSDMKCQAMQANEELRKLEDNELKASHKLECAFQIYYQKMYEQVIPMIGEDKPKDEIIAMESIDVNEEMKCKFLSMQNMMKLMIKNKSVPKKEWRSYISNPKK